MFAFDLLRVDLADGVGSRGKMALIDARRIRVEVLQAKGLEQFLHLNKNRIRATPERIRQDYATQMVNRMPQPALVGFAAHETPHLIHLCRLYAPHFDRGRLQTTALHDAFVYLRETGGFFLTP